MEKKVHYGTVRQYAHARGRVFQDVYEEIKKQGGLQDKDAVIVKENKEVMRVRWN
jgi:predicted transcriptional regulator